MSDFNESVELWDRDRKIAEIETRIDREHEDEGIRKLLKEVFLEQIDEQEKAVREVDARMHERAEIADFYPQSDYALLMNIPSNVTPEWRETCEEMKQLARQAGWTF